MNNYTCIIVDDETIAAKLLSQIIEEQHPNIEITGIYSTPNNALVALKTTTPDIVFMDISMPGKSGFELLSYVPDLKSEIIFVTAHAEFAIHAFDFPTAGYVLKPVDELALNKAIQRAADRIDKKKSGTEQSRTKVPIPNNRGLDFIETAEVIYIEALAKNTRIKTTNREIISTQSFGTLKSLFPHQTFCQVHRSFIINLNHIKRYEADTIIMDDNSTIPLTRSLKDSFFKALMVSKDI